MDIRCVVKLHMYFAILLLHDQARVAEPQLSAALSQPHV